MEFCVFLGCGYVRVDVRWEESSPLYHRPVFTLAGLCFSSMSWFLVFLQFFSSFLFSSLFFPPLYITTVPNTKTTLLISKTLTHTHIITQLSPDLQTMCTTVIFRSVLVLSVIVTSDHFNTTFTHLALLPPV